METTSSFLLLLYLRSAFLESFLTLSNSFRNFSTSISFPIRKEGSSRSSFRRVTAVSFAGQSITENDDLSRKYFERRGWKSTSP